MELNEARRVLENVGYRLLKESSTYTISKPGVRVDIGANSYFANRVTATGELTAGCGCREYDEFEIDPDSIVPTVEWWTDEGNEIEETEELVSALCEVLAGLDGWKPVDTDDYHI